jgi:hypothetical protein
MTRRDRSGLVVYKMKRYSENCAFTPRLANMERLRNILRCIYVDAFWKEFDLILKRECNGCTTDHESQDQHDVCMNPREHVMTPRWYEEAWDKVDEGLVHFTYYQTVANIRCPYHVLNISREIVNAQTMLINSHYNMDFKSSVSSQDYEEIQTARNKIERLEQRLLGRERF